jgi:hypothetical protein
MCWLQHAALLRHYPHVLLLLMAALGLVECFFGFRAWGFLRGANGMLVGGLAALLAGIWLLHSPVLAIVGLVLGAVGGAILFATVECVGTFAISFFTGASCTWVLAVAAQVTIGTVVVGVIIAAGMVTAGAAVVGGGRAIIVLTALAGGQQLAAISMAYWYPETAGPVISLPELAIILILAGVGMTVQFFTRPPNSPLPDAD